jgi:glycosyltransferase EpsE
LKVCYQSNGLNAKCFHFWLFYVVSDRGSILSGQTLKKISIVMAAYNEERDIGRAIESIQAQTLSDWELIVVNDGSTDGTEDIVRQYASQDARIRLITNEINLGLPTSLNRGIEVASTDLIARADADDTNLPDRLERQYAFLQKNPEVDVLGTGAWLLDANGMRVNKASLPESHDELAKLSFLKTPFFHPSVLIRRRFFDKAGKYDAVYVRTEDRELWLRGLQKGCQYANLPEPLIEYATDGYVRSWRSILHQSLSLLKIARAYKTRNGYVLVAMSVLHSALIKMRLYKPVSLRAI